RRSIFDLSTDALLRATLVRMRTDESVLLLGVHHLAWDHWSIQIFFHELSSLYRAFSRAKPSPLSEPPIQYKDYAQWQRTLFCGAEFDNDLACWKERLPGAPATLTLPIDRPRQPLTQRRGGRRELVLSKETTGALAELAREADVTEFMIFLAAFNTLLHKITGQDDIVAGTPVAGRDRSETESLIGLFLNTLALRTNLSGNPTFLELLKGVREVTLGAYDHREYPFEKLVEELRPDRDLTTTPLFQVFINMYNFKEAKLELEGLRVQSLRSPAEDAVQFDLEFHIRKHDDGTHLLFAYDADLFESATIVRLLRQFQTLLEGIATHPDRHIAELPLLTEAEKHQLLVEWNDTKRNYPSAQCIHQLVEDQVERSPDAVAVVFADRPLTYPRFNNQANQLARYLSKRGVRPEVRVGICVERSIEMIVGLLSILTTRGAYVPLDPKYPKERLVFMLEDSRVSVLLTQGSLVEGIVSKPVMRRSEVEEIESRDLPSSIVDSRIELVCLDQDWDTIACEDLEN